MRLKVFGTGSKGNCYALTAEDGRTVLLDAGVSYREIMKGIDHHIDSVDICLCTHAHQDHARSVIDLLANGVTVAMSAGTAEMILDDDDYLRVQTAICKSMNQFKAADWTIVPFDIDHDAAEPLGFLIAHNDRKILYLTDTDHCKYQFKDLNFLIVECNYMAEILAEKEANNEIAKPFAERLRNSHIALETLVPWMQALDLDKCEKIVLVHLSAANSNEQRMIETVEKATGITTVCANAGDVLDLDAIGF